jgi:hypothetical protein
MTRTWRNFVVVSVVAVGAACAISAYAQAVKPVADCSGLPDYATLRATLQRIVKQGQASNTGLGNQEWAVVVNRDGLVCSVVFSGADRGAQWPGSRVIAAEKASTANALSVPDFALSTANLYAASQPGQSLYSLVPSAPPNPQAVYSGSPTDYGQPNEIRSSAKQSAASSSLAAALRSTTARENSSEGSGSAEIRPAPIT